MIITFKSMVWINLIFPIIVLFSGCDTPTYQSILPIITEHKLKTPTDTAAYFLINPSDCFKCQIAMRLIMSDMDKYLRIKRENIYIILPTIRQKEIKHIFNKKLEIPIEKYTYYSNDKLFETLKSLVKIENTNTILILTDKEHKIKFAKDLLTFRINSEFKF